MQGFRKDLLFLVTEHKEMCILEYDADSGACKLPLHMYNDNLQYHCCVSSGMMHVQWGMLCRHAAGRHFCSEVAMQGS